MITSKLIGVLAVLALGSMFMTSSFATTYYGPSFSFYPSHIPPGGTVNIVITTVSANYFVQPPSGSDNPCQPGQVCAFPLQSCVNASEFYYSIHEVTVTDPNGNEYMLGSSTTSGLAWPTDLGGPANDYQTIKNGFADALNVTVGDNYTLPFGPAAGGYTYTSVLPNPPNDVTPAGPYYWWTVQGNANGNNLRLDQHPNINPTSVSGTYTVDIEGEVECGPGAYQSLGVLIFFDAPAQFQVPQFAIPATAAAAVTFAALLILYRRKGILGRKAAKPSVPYMP
jgi:hypothetical protein